MKKKPHNIFMIIYYLFKGKVNLIRKLNKEVSIDINIFPLNKEIINDLIEKNKSGHEIIFITKFKKELDDFLNNLHYEFKNYKIIKDLSEYQENKNEIIFYEFPKHKSKKKKDFIKFILYLIQAFRIHQWSKNFLVFTPLLLAHHFTIARSWMYSFLAFAAFSFVASSVYLINDIFDLESDRKHKIKKNRPFANGSFPLSSFFIYFPATLGIGLCLGKYLGIDFLIILLLYLVLNLIYTFKIKSIIVSDVILLGFLYNLRIIAGSIAIQVEYSSWLMAFSTFFFLGLALAKRYLEIFKNGDKDTIDGRGYMPQDKIIILILGIASSLVSIVILVFYFNSLTAEKLYDSTYRLWFIAPLVLYWTARFWILANRNMILEDLSVFAIRDKVTWLVFFASLGIILWAI
ncbi:MAG: UbiA family prenyltransferase [Silvanigrellaceae bacterium]|nr:UbiA family prenyltransferase [Silvanigrellaceae bacterium]